MTQQGGQGHDPYGPHDPRRPEGPRLTEVTPGHRQQVPGDPGHPAGARRGGLSTAAWAGLGALAVLVVGGGALAGLLAGRADPGPAVPTAGGAPPASTPTPTPTQAPTPMPSSTPTPTASAPPVVDGRVRGDGFSLALPAEWQVEGWGHRNDGRVTLGASDITVYRFGPGDPAAACTTEVDVLEIWVPGTIEPLPERTVGGAPAYGSSLTGDGGEYYELLCVLHRETVYNLSLQTTVTDRQQAVATWSSVLDTWAWT